MAEKLKRKIREQDAPNAPIVLPESAESTTALATSTAPKLTDDQKRLLIELIAKHHWYNVVMAEVKEIDPDFPDLTERMIQYYRAQIRAGQHDEWLAPLMALHAYEPLTSRESRIRELRRQYRQLDDLPAFMAVGMSFVNVAAQRQAILAQIAKEQGHDRPPPGPGVNVNILNAGGASSVVGDDVAMAAAEAAMERIEARLGMAAALEGSQRPIDPDVIEGEFTATSGDAAQG